MKLIEVFENVADQEKGREIDLLDPFTGAATGFKFWLAGPDSVTARRARMALSDELAEMADSDGRVTAEQRETARLNSLACLVLRWDIREDDGRSVPLTQQSLMTLLRIQWVQEQLDDFAGDRRNFAPERQMFQSGTLGQGETV